MTLFGCRFSYLWNRMSLLRKKKSVEKIGVLKKLVLISFAPATTILHGVLPDFEECWYDNRRKETLPLETMCYCTFMELQLWFHIQKELCDSRGQFPPLHWSRLRWEIWISEGINVMLCGSQSWVLYGVDLESTPFVLSTGQPMVVREKGETEYVISVLKVLHFELCWRGGFVPGSPTEQHG